jgi:hypothetical protein
MLILIFILGMSIGLKYPNQDESKIWIENTPKLIDELIRMNIKQFIIDI